MAAAPAILRATADRPLADQLGRRLGKADGATVLLVTPALANDPQKNDMASKALDALAQQRLVLVQVDGAEAPLGLRDVAAIPWRATGAESDADIERIAQAVSSVAAAAPAMPAPAKRKRGGAWVWGAVIVGVLLFVVIVPSFVFMANDQYGSSGISVEEPPPAQMAPADNVILRNLRVMGEALSQQGFTTVGAEPLAGQLSAGESANAPIILLVEAEYRVAAVCDDDCSGLGISLLDGNNEVVARSTDVGVGSVLEFTPTATGEYSVRIDMTECTVAPCFYAISLFARSAGTTGPVPTDQVPTTTPNPDTLPAPPEDPDTYEPQVGAFVSGVNWTAVLAIVLAAMILVGVILQVITLTVLLRRPKEPRRKGKKGAAVAALPAGAAGGLFFASYSRKDREKVDAVIGAIEREGLPIWLDRIDIGGGATWPEAIVQAIRGARGVIVFCSSNAFDSDNVLREVNLAANYDKPLLPILLEPTQVPDSFFYYLSTRQMVDLSTDANWRAKVLESLKTVA